MTTSMGLKLTPGQRCLLDILQRKLLNTIQCYAKLSLQKQESGTHDALEIELQRLKEKIRRISARQKRFTLEIINGNGNNTIPKESFFEALGLVTKEVLNKLNSKTNERRRRTTANPRFSHEAIQAKRALEPLHKRLESRVKDKRESARKPQRHQSNNFDATNNINNNNNNNNNNINSGNNNNVHSGKGNNQQASNNNSNARTNSRLTSSSGRDRSLLINDDRRELLVQFSNLHREINTKVKEIKDKRESNKKLERSNELIRKRGLDIISAINMLNPDMTFQEGSELSPQNNHSHESNNQQGGQPAEPLDIWIDMKCDESLDGLD